MMRNIKSQGLYSLGLSTVSNLTKFALFINAVVISSLTMAGTLPSIELKAGKEKIQVQVASTPDSQQLGLMYRRYLPENEGMLFQFSDKAGHCFWMRNTEIPLSIAFIGDDGRVVNIEEMQAHTDDNHCPVKPIRFALEMNKAWFTLHNINPGSLIDGLPRL